MFGIWYNLFQVIVMTNTFEQIYAIARKIPVGCVATYGQIAKLMGNPRMSRVVGYAMHSCPADVPAHRVVNRKGELCAHFVPLGKETHRMLLELEGVPFLGNGNIDVENCLWKPDAE